MIWIPIIWIALGLHSAWFLLNSKRLEEDVEMDSTLIAMMIFSFLFPLITHLATLMTFYIPNKEFKNPRVFKKRVFKKKVKREKNESIFY